MYNMNINVSRELLNSIKHCDLWVTTEKSLEIL